MTVTHTYILGRESVNGLEDITSNIREVSVKINGHKPLRVRILNYFKIVYAFIGSSNVREIQDLIALIAIYSRSIACTCKEISTITKTLIKRSKAAHIHQKHL